MKNIVIIGGGTGTFTLLSGLRQFPSNNAVIVSTADDGGSTGVLRKDLDIVPPGDIRQCLVGLSYTDQALRDLFSYRFAEGSLKGHTVGNIILAALQKVDGNVEKAIARAAKLLNVRGEVVPVTMKPTLLSATLSNGKKIVGEHFIDEPRHNTKLSIRSLQLRPSGPANPRALAIIRQADAIIFGPGDLYTSTIPSLLVDGMAAAVRTAKAQKILITNIMTKAGQTNGYKASDFVTGLESYLSSGKQLGKIDTVIVNNQKPSAAALAQYRKVDAEFVDIDLAKLKALGVKVVAKPLVAKDKIHKVKGDPLQRSFLRHDAKKTAALIWQLVA